jgi:hypothetical protein
MFESLAERIKEDERGTVNNTQKMIFWLVVVLISVVVFGGLYFGVRMIH